MNQQVYLERSQRWINCDTPQGVGGQGSFCPVIGEPGLGVKFYKSMTPSLAFRLGEIVRIRVKNRLLAWPVDRVRNAPGGDVVGVLLERIHGIAGLVIVEEMLAKAKNIDVDFATRIWIARECVAGVIAVHQAGYLLEDVNESNVFIELDPSKKLQPKPRVVLIDLDGSLRLTFRDPQSGRIIQSSAGVARDEYLPPEILKLGSSIDLKSISRNKQHDIFAVAVLVWLFLTGVHPYSAKNTTGQIQPQDLTEWIRNGWWPWMPIGQLPSGWMPNHGKVKPFLDFPVALRDWFTRCFHEGSVDSVLRPSLSNLMQILDDWHWQLNRVNWLPSLKFFRIFHGFKNRWQFLSFKPATHLSKIINRFWNWLRVQDGVTHARLAAVSLMTIWLLWMGYQKQIKNVLQRIWLESQDQPQKLPPLKTNPYVNAPSLWNAFLEIPHERSK